jgi:hypothetical protein
MKNETKYKSLKRLFKRVVKGKVFQKDEFGTSLFDMTLRGAIGRQQIRPEGSKKAPAKLLLKPINSQHKPSAVPTRIFIGSEIAQHRGERVLLWSILKHRDPNKYYEVYIMKDLVGFDRRFWKTGFTAYRYAIPELAGFQGRAIYNDVDQIYLDDPATLQAEAMSGSAVLALHSRDTSVMLMDCGKLTDIWTMAAIHAAPEKRVHATMLNLVREENLIADLPANWNSRDHEYDNLSSKLLHYTILHTQPWRPFPKYLNYRKNPLGGLWHDLEKEADQQSFALQWKHQPGRPYKDMKAFFEVENDE